MDRKQEIDDFIKEMENRYEIRDSFKKAARDKLYTMIDNFPEEKFNQILRASEVNFKRHAKNYRLSKDSDERSREIKEGRKNLEENLHKIFGCYTILFEKEAKRFDDQITEFFVKNPPKTQA